MKVQVILLGSCSVGILADFFTPGLETFARDFDFLDFLRWTGMIADNPFFSRIF